MTALNGSNSDKCTVPNRLHLACRKHVSEIHWLVPPKLSDAVLRYRASFSRDIASMSDETVEAMCIDKSAAMWVRNIAAAELVIRGKSK